MNFNKLINLIGIISTGFVLSTTSTQAAVVHDNGPPTVFSSESDLDGVSRAADHFTLASSATISNITWSGVYFSSNTPTEPDDFTIRFYHDNAGLPDNSGLIGSAYTPGNAVNRVDSGNNGAGGQDIFNYSVDITPLMLSAGTYWLSIINDTTADTDDNWTWSFSSTPSTGGGSSAAQVGSLSTWQSINAENSFTLNNVSAVPVPAAVWLMGSALAGLVGFHGVNQALLNLPFSYHLIRSSCSGSGFVFCRSGYLPRKKRLIEGISFSI